MRRALGYGLGTLAAAGLGLWLLSAPAPLSSTMAAELVAVTPDADYGEQVFWLAGCASCHTAPDAEHGAGLPVLSGGRAFATPFGTFHAPNISSDPVHGLGAWSLNDFAQALWLGTSPEGAHYYPAFPYTTYAHASAQDVADLWAFWGTLPADATPSQPHDLGFPFSIRRTLFGWKWLNLHTDFATPESDDPSVQRGRYLVEAWGHCAECHTPRDALGGLRRDAWMQGAPNPAGQGRIPALPPQGWSVADIAAYLETGFTPEFDSAGGEMADVVRNMARIAPEDRQAIAAYLVALRSGPNR